MTTPVKLTPELVAKALTQVYLYDLPDYYPDVQPAGTDVGGENPLNITNDPAFQTLNPEVPRSTRTDGRPADHRRPPADNQLIWD